MMLTANSRSNRWSLVFSLLLATVIRMFLVIISYGCKVPAGIFVPSMAIGATFGRMIGILVQALHEAFPTSRFFASCAPDVPCITPGTYAFLGAGAALSGIMHITVSVVVIMFELTGALTYILPTMIVVGVTKAVSDRFSHGGIADRMIWFNGFPFLDNKEEHSFGVPVSQVMTTHLSTLPASDISLHEVEQLMSDSSMQGFPIVESRSSKTLVGYIGLTELRYAIDRAKRENPAITEMTICNFDTAATSQPSDVPAHSYADINDGHDANTNTPTRSSAPLLNRGSSIYPDSTANALDFSRFINPTPLTVHPRIPLETVMELFKKMGPRIILVEYHGKLTGLVTVKDCLKYQFSAHASGEAAAAGGANGSVGGPARREEDSEDERLKVWEGKIWSAISRAGDAVRVKVEMWSGGRIVLGEPGQSQPVVAASTTAPGTTNRYVNGMSTQGRRDVELDDR
jgi:chloride channel 3/4/5